MCARHPALLGIAASGIYLLIQAMHDGNSNAANHYSDMSYSLLYWLAPIVEFTIGIYLIVCIWQLVEKLFKDEAE